MQPSHEAQKRGALEKRMKISGLSGLAPPSGAPEECGFAFGIMRKLMQKSVPLG